MQTKTDTDLIHRTISTSAVPTRSNSYGIHVMESSLNRVEQWQTVDYLCVNGLCSHEFRTMQIYLYWGPGSGLHESSILLLPNNKGTLTTFVILMEANFGISPVQVWMLYTLFKKNI